MNLLGISGVASGSENEPLPIGLFLKLINKKERSSIFWRQQRWWVKILYVKLLRMVNRAVARNRFIDIGQNAC
jgi:hypothetical protein